MRPWLSGCRDGFRGGGLALSAAALLAAALAGSCGGGGEGDPATSCASAGTPSLTVGGGSAQSGFASLTDGDPMSVVLGPQGLYMVTPSIRVQGLAPGKSGRSGHADDPLVALEAHVGTTLVGASLRDHLGLTVTPDGAERLGIFLPFDGDQSAYLNKRVRISATATDLCARTARGELAITAVP